MLDVTSKNLIPLCILRILERYSDYDHPLRQSEILEHLKDEYNVTAERKAIGRTIERLSCELEIDIDSDGRGFWLVSREFEDYEIKLLIDSVMSNKYLSEADSHEIEKKLKSLSNEYFKYNNSNVVLLDSKKKINNRDVLYNHELVEEAIDTMQCVCFDYTSWDRKPSTRSKRIGHHVEFPISVLFMEQRYYMVVRAESEDGKNHMDYYALDKMRNVRIAESNEAGAKPITREEKSKLADVANLREPMDIAKDPVRFYAKESLLHNIEDTFGSSIMTVKRLSAEDESIGTDADDYDVSLAVPYERFLPFLRQNMDRIILVSPPALQNLYIQQLQMALSINHLQVDSSYDSIDRNELNDMISSNTRLSLGLPKEFGRYPATTDGTSAPIEWLVLRKEGRSAVLVSKDILDVHTYFNEYNPQELRVIYEFWSGTDIQRWLNDEFLQNAFTDKERTQLVPDENGDVVTLMTPADLRMQEYIYPYITPDITEYAEEKCYSYEDMKSSWFGQDKSRLLRRIHCGVIDSQGRLTSYTYSRGLDRGVYVSNPLGIRPMIKVKL